MNIKDRIVQKEIFSIKREIESANDNEILIIGHTEPGKKVFATEVVAHGNKISVPALKQYMQKGDVVLHNHPSGNLSPSNADINIAAMLGSYGIGFYIINNEVDKLYIVSEPVEVKKVEPVDSFKLLKLLKPGGIISSLFNHYEERESQAVMLETVIESFNNSTISVIEAGTGTGKSLAYLIPVFKWTEKNDERVVISTATINLQQQIVENDAILAAKICDVSPKISIVKGRSNYICHKRYYETLEENALFNENNEELKVMGEWLETTKTGDRSDLSFYPNDDLWGSICSEADLCTGIRCPWHEKCFVLKARKRAAASKVLVVNHHLLFSDLSMRRSGGLGFDEPAVLPPFMRIIFDEAHNIEKSASSYFSESFSFTVISKYLKRIARVVKGKNIGLYYYVKKNYKPKDKVYTKIPGIVKKILASAENLDIGILSLVGKSGSSLFNELINEESRARIYELIKVLNKNLLKFNALWEASLSNMDEIVSESDAVYELKALIGRLNSIASICDRFMHYNRKKELIFWVEKIKTFKGEFHIRFVITPLEISSIMHDVVYKQYMTVVFTSATLTVNNSFEYWKSRIGLDSYGEKEIIELSLPSPFNFEENVLLGIPMDLPLPNEDSYINSISDFILKLLLISGGHALVLFTSYSMLKEVHKNVSEKITGSGIKVFFQGQDDRKRLLDKFLEDSESTLFATNSFWEGIDAPGNALELVIICRLPFSVPTDPILMARVKAIEEGGGNPFTKLSLPEAVIRFRQGFGRLIRKGTDRGIVAVLDSRIIIRNYGKSFINSIPKTKLSVGESGHVLEDVKYFIGKIRNK